jgi:peptidyl-tRNA hydrolase, PTH1 family
MWFVVGLGNPGREYERTRHNVGFDVIEKLGVRHRFPAARQVSGALTTRGRIAGQEVMLIAPQTYMNLSGDAVGAIVRFYKAEAESLIVVHDELDFEPGAVRVKVGGGHGGHNGLRSVMAHMGDEFVRVRVGIGKPASKAEGADHVLSRPDPTARKLMEEATDRAADAVELVIAEGVAQAMNRVNRREPKADDEEPEAAADERKPPRAKATED